MVSNMKFVLDYKLETMKQNIHTPCSVQHATVNLESRNSLAAATQINRRSRGPNAHIHTTHHHIHTC